MHFSCTSYQLYRGLKNMTIYSTISQMTVMSSLPQLICLAWASLLHRMDTMMSSRTHVLKLSSNALCISKELSLHTPTPHLASKASTPFSSSSPPKRRDLSNFIRFLTVSLYDSETKYVLRSYSGSAMGYSTPFSFGGGLNLIFCPNCPWITDHL